MEPKWIWYYTTNDSIANDTFIRPFQKKLRLRCGHSEILLSYLSPESCQSPGRLVTYRGACTNNPHFKSSQKTYWVWKLCAHNAILLRIIATSQRFFCPTRDWVNASATPRNNLHHVVWLPPSYMAPWAEDFFWPLSICVAHHIFPPAIHGPSGGGRVRGTSGGAI